jgi:hypothetical protein
VVLKNAPKNAQMTSPKIQNDLINSCAKETTGLILQDLGAECFSIIADESSDVYHNEQLAVCLRYVDKKGRVLERFLGVVHVDNTAASTLKSAIQSWAFSLFNLANICLRDCGQSQQDFIYHVRNRISVCISPDLSS